MRKVWKQREVQSLALLVRFWGRMEQEAKISLLSTTLLEAYAHPAPNVYSGGTISTAEGITTTLFAFCFKTREPVQRWHH